MQSDIANYLKRQLLLVTAFVTLNFGPFSYERTRSTKATRAYAPTTVLDINWYCKTESSSTPNLAYILRWFVWTCHGLFSYFYWLYHIIVGLYLPIVAPLCSHAPTTELNKLWKQTSQNLWRNALVWMLDFPTSVSRLDTSYSRFSSIFRLNRCQIVSVLPMVSAKSGHTVLLRSDGVAVACGDNSFGQCNIPRLEDGMTFTQVSAGMDHTVLLRSDGVAVACGANSFGHCNIPLLEDGMTFTQVSAGKYHTVLLRSDGVAVACGGNRFGQCDIPRLEDGMTYIKVSAGMDHSVLLGSDGVAVACGGNSCGQCNIPCLEDGMTYTQVSAGMYHTVLLRSDGVAMACGGNSFRQCNIPHLEDRMTYTQVSAASMHTVLLRSDGVAVACGFNLVGQCNIPPSDPGTWYAADVSVGSNLVLQLDCAFQDDTMLLTFSGLTGDEVMHLNASPFEPAWNTHKRVASELKVPLQSLRVVLPDGQLLASACRANPGAGLADVVETHKHRRLT